MLPVQITIREMANSPALEAHVRKKSEKLSLIYKRISSCRVVVEFAQKQKHRGKLYNVRIDVTVPGKELVVTRKANEDPYAAINQAFDALARQLEEHSKRRQGNVKKHAVVMSGHVKRMLESDGYGFIEGDDGNEYYFSVTNVSHPDFSKLEIGDEVHYTPNLEDEGWKALHVTRHNHSR